MSWMQAPLATQMVLSPMIPSPLMMAPATLVHGVQDRAGSHHHCVTPRVSLPAGTLRAGVPDGLGTCTWVDGTQYDGEWRSGLMHGFGTYLWTSGQRYDGEWKVRCPGAHAQ